MRSVFFDMNSTFIATLALVGGLAPTQDVVLPGKPAPHFAGKLTTGKQFDLTIAAKEKPVLVFFISTTCPVTSEATKFYDRISKAYAKHGVTVVGVVNDAKKGYDAWQKIHKTSFGSLLDPDYKVITAFGVYASPTTILVAPGGKVEKVWIGYGQKELKSANEGIAKLLGKPVAKVDLAGAPTETALG